MAEIEIDYAPRTAFMPFHARTARESVLVCHRRAGKTVAIANDAPMKAFAVQRPYPPARIGWMYPTRVRAKDIAWGYLKHYTQKFPGVRHIESELAVEFTDGRRVTLYGADNSRGVGLYLDGMYYDEADEIPQKVVAEVAPALSDYEGFTVHSGMLRGRHNLWKRMEAAKGKPDMFSLMLRGSESGILPAKELALLRVQMGESAYQLQVECNVNASLANAIYGAQMDEMRRANRIKAMPIDPEWTLDFFFDIGHSLTGDDWSIWAIQSAGRDILAHRYYARTGELPSHYAAWVLNCAAQAGLAVGTVYLPHDGSRKDRQGRTAVDDLKAAGIQRIKVVARTPVLWDSINQLRALMPRMWINYDGCSETWQLGEVEMPSGIDCLDYYSKKEDASTGIITDVPIHDQYSHGADAMRTYSEAYRLGMIEGVSHIARDSRRSPDAPGGGSPKVLRGAGPQSYSINSRNRARVLR